VNNEKQNHQQVDSRIRELENMIRGIAKAPTMLETNAQIEIALAVVDGREPEQWASEYMDYATSTNGQYF